ncbi:MAG: hypothetical protein JHC61_02465 [Burkholderiaceae bacterium]|nr:hypothetical protein [Burkholderiaceae bacterium]
MHRLFIIVASLMAETITGPSWATNADVSLTFDLSAELRAPPLRAARSAEHPSGPVVIDERLDNGNPHAQTLKIDVWGGEGDVQAQLVEHFALQSGEHRIPMILIKRNQAMSPAIPMHVAHRHEVENRVKTLVFSVTGQSTSTPPPGHYTGQFVVLFEPHSAL